MSKMSGSIIRRVAVAVFGLAAVLCAGPQQSQADAALARGKWVKEYKLQIKYLLVDRESFFYHSYWETVLVTEDADTASYWLQLSNFAYLAGHLNDLWMHDNPSYFAVDVRMVISSKFKPSRPRAAASRASFR